MTFKQVSYIGIIVIGGIVFNVLVFFLVFPKIMEVFGTHSEVLQLFLISGVCADVSVDICEKQVIFIELYDWIPAIVVVIGLYSGLVGQKFAWQAAIAIIFINATPFLYQAIEDESLIETLSVVIAYGFLSCAVAISTTWLYRKIKSTRTPTP